MTLLYSAVVSMYAVLCRIAKDEAIVTQLVAQFSPY
jgi:hypothetical protein